ncbi:Hypothetical protein LBF_0415 [Leptospira biflexa serovar Patoc strain 'Patoc 1 (Ames)']|uniref:Transposase IS801/IS1294 domain-containing protein n=1 Tax=Leptospira biflexa serovar Patoc (strain Patoc 1 / ATCC 23582 / Paris) TaxID=456481 RepID=B0SK19_LEPBP|nr:transposase [Leptospira biflexa]ABZ92960.1 Hypothetical protein LBF_0415 [Leptospira biflexa serovar Patoc strain 'Patoc 1 (Ames)']ABZ96575.1 Hypothetical protein LEPBI_I0434 [Leptospira biflexa serovar Patoc strain 'Patoc 1 (Paris)']
MGEDVYTVGGRAPFGSGYAGLRSPSDRFAPLLSLSRESERDYLFFFRTPFFKSNVESITKEKSYQSLTMPIDEFLARMLFFLPKKDEKSVRYYGIYVRPAKKIRHQYLDKKSSWAEAIKSSFDVKDPLACPVCKFNPHFFRFFA